MLFRSRKQANAMIPGPPALIQDILTDYQSYSQWLPQVSKSALLAREGNLAIAEFELAPAPEQKLSMECIHAANLIILRCISGNLPLIKMEWSTAAADANGSNVTLKMEWEAGRHTVTGAYRNLLNPRNCLAALQSIASSYATETAGSDPAREKIFELLESEEGLYCWFRGTKYELKAVS